MLSRAGERSTVLLSTRQTEDVAALCDRVVVLDQGRIRFDGSVSAFVLDEPAAAAVDAVPNTRRRRTTVRTTAVALPLAVWILGILALEQRNAVTPAGALLVEGAGVLAVAVASAAILRLVGRADAGEAVASVLGLAMLGVIIFNPPPRSVPIFPIYDGWAASTALWASVGVTATILMITVSRDPYRRQVKAGRLFTSRRP